MKLALQEASGTIKNGTSGSADLCGYDVTGLPAGECAQIAQFNQAWRILRWNDEWHGNWSGSYPTAEAALDALRKEFSVVA